MADLKELAHHLKPFFFPSNGLASGPHCTRAVIRELVRVITRVLLSSSDKGRAGALRLGLQGPRVCEASPFSRSLHHQGRAGPSPVGCGSTGALRLFLPISSQNGTCSVTSLSLLGFVAPLEVLSSSVMVPQNESYLTHRELRLAFHL